MYTRPRYLLLEVSTASQSRSTYSVSAKRRPLHDFASRERNSSSQPLSFQPLRESAAKYALPSGPKPHVGSPLMRAGSCIAEVHVAPPSELTYAYVSSQSSLVLPVMAQAMSRRGSAGCAAICTSLCVKPACA